MPLFETMPKLLKLLYVGIISINASRLIGAVIGGSWRRRLLYMIVGLYLVIQFFVFIALPAPVMRVFTALVGASWSNAVFLAGQNQPGRRSLIYLSGRHHLAELHWLWVFFSQAAGYVAFSNHLLDITIKTVFLGVIAWMINLILRGTIEAIFDNRFVRK